MKLQHKEVPLPPYGWFPEFDDEGKKEGELNSKEKVDKLNNVLAKYLIQDHKVKINQAKIKDIEFGKIDENNNNVLIVDLDGCTINLGYGEREKINLYDIPPELLILY